MKKIGIITFHRANNFGAALQVYALSRFLKRTQGYTVEIIDYRNPFIGFTDTVRLFPISANWREIVSGFYTFPYRLGRLKRFQKFWRYYYSTGRTYHSQNQIKKNPPDCDAFVCGSDQIWNPKVTLQIDPAYFLTFVHGPKKKISYAASIGITDLNARELKKMQKWLSSFFTISVREEEGIKILQPWVRQKIEHSIDPTFLLTKEQWDHFAGPRILTGPYILLYIMQNNHAVYEYARSIKKILGIPVVAISRYGYKADCVDRVLVDVGPREFVNLFAHAEFVCTNSFHGLAFSLIFLKKFFVIPSTRFNSRINNLLHVFEIKEENVITEGNVNNYMYDPEIILSHIKNERKKTEAYFQNALGPSL